MLDNASGSATILDIAQKMKNVNPLNKLRFIWFGGEELGLLGSQYYVNNLSRRELSHIGYDLDADVTATPNYLIGVLDPAAAGPLQPHSLRDVPEPRLQGVAGRARSGDRLSSTPSGSTTSSFHRPEPTRSTSTASGSPPAVC